MEEISFSVILIAVITAYIGYKFNDRTKKKEKFIKELTNSYNEVYFPMYELLLNITKAEDSIQRDKLLEDFLVTYSGVDSKIRFIGTCSILEYFYDLRSTYNKYIKENKQNESILSEKLTNLLNMIETEFWDAHDIIYEDHIQFKDDSFKNPFLVVSLSILRVIYYFTSFALGLSFLVLYVVIWDRIIPVELLPKEVNFQSTIGLILFLTMVYGMMFTIKEFAVKRNRRKSKSFKNIVRRIKSKVSKKN
ncbi:hypothetical protein [Desulfosporosinus sp.]|uniref:hypothetical protein n=1 Tax=Desulfosporosinus sp. TaxID=157907 RepID=UPI0025BC51B1|nr:hypothetical protein [Desulfosporosinus sp.]MBC2728636.1 hypothetical protein [Desulfosporosinus sp.]